MRVIRESNDGPPERTRRVPFRRFVSPVIVVAALAVGYLLLTQLVPKLAANLGQIPQSVNEHWSAPVWSVSRAVNNYRGVAAGACTLAAAVAFLLTVLSRPTAALVYLAGVCLCLLDVVMLLGALACFYGQLLDNVM
mgnify:CR=1 FL=1